ncbi:MULTISPECIES: AbrB/MazE/SpoVT family DNA-binding domain-containing protein [Rhizobium]|uniref:AbrB/MazE/SpoVT family DNA-binding domain-containing protein n=1 Tax=Rhizobium changzhiense TaxID=2692317 RepID=A0A7Z0RJX7_9HYPH|nr:MULTISPECIES: AbrB/MazE/SpoVT family DNA-binding domain-containing protein [unclassified Rhizobium]MBA5801688.1 AbrB/MazE/SpoVT family DNA-binding domain-containing protein [Rhizobium changzhiense]MCH4545539.1 AbrB/MazE/SpoVT family DNA-binding domain-containing protein [Rhizobium changzhiense]MCV9941672.1 AbrB/MazE/SpoVT family DNA-binding domain-containing protein [Rhizobium sp. BT-175]MCW0016372.1 AbrB/MazE/SpoVT family DNA-binding domain-containing protein [Rhizobium sp. BT-226]NNU49756
MATLTVTAKGQVTLKKEVLQHLGVRPGDKIDVDLLPGGKLEVVAVERQPVTGSIESFFGSLENKENIHATLEEIDEAVKAGWAGEVGIDHDR